MIFGDSSAIAKIAYKDRMLAIRFHSRFESYSFPNVPEQFFKCSFITCAVRHHPLGLGYKAQFLLLLA